jgi:fructosamine-3-kinase
MNTVSSRSAGHPDNSLPRLPDHQIKSFVIDSGLVGASDDVKYSRLTGGVASDIWLVESGSQKFCVKRALPKLRVAADWYAPIERNANEAAWLRAAGEIDATTVPKILVEDPKVGAFAMEYFTPDSYPNWKAQLRDGHVDPRTVALVAQKLVRIHAQSSRKPGLIESFQTDSIFMAIRLAPYLLSLRNKHTDLASRIDRLVERTISTKKALVHGDMSPKNILIGRVGPIFLDAECAWWGDPAFDLAFCLNHLLLKCIWYPPGAEKFLAAFKLLSTEYLEQVDWEDREGLESRTAELLPALFLGRVDGKSPVEYITTEPDKDLVRSTARELIGLPKRSLAAVADVWGAKLKQRML